MTSDAGDKPMGSAAEERRGNPQLRSNFDRAVEVTAPFFNSAQGWGGNLKLYARHTLRETFPELGQQDISILLAVVERAHRSKRQG